MIRQMESTLRTRVLIVFALVHLGLICSLFATARLTIGRELDWSFGLLVMGIASLYLGSVFGAFFLVWPLLPWFKRAQEARDWGQQLLHDLPRVLELIQKTIEMVKPLLQNGEHTSANDSTPPRSVAAEARAQSTHFKAAK